MDLESLATVVRRDSLAMIYFAESGHPGGVLSCADIISTLWHNELTYEPATWNFISRNRLILSKGHSVPLIYSLAARYGLLKHGQEMSLRKLGSPLQGHPHVLDTPWVETSTGSLGQGFSFAIGAALGLRYQTVKSKIYVVMGDGELQEGQVWEAAMSGAHFQLSNLCVFIDYNKLQSDDKNQAIMGLEPLARKWDAFGWNVLEIDGHCLSQIRSAVSKFKQEKNRPTVIIAHTVKGKGVSFMEGAPNWHGSVKIKKEELIAALEDLKTSDIQIKSYLNGTFWKEIG